MLIGLKKPALLTRETLEAESRALLDRMTTTPTAKQRREINRLIRAFKRLGVWNRLDVFWVLVAIDEQAAYRNWIKDQYNLTANGGYTFTPNGGILTNGSTGYLGSGFSPALAAGKYARDDAYVGLWAMSLAGTGRCGTNFSRLGWSSGPNSYTRLNDTTTQTNPTAADTRLISVSRSSPESYVERNNGVDKIVRAVASTGIANAELTIGKSDTLYGAGAYGAYMAGQSMTADQDLGIYRALSAYMSAMAA